MNTRLKYLDEQEWLELARCAEWSVGKLAKLCNVSARGLELHFLNKMGKTPKYWLVEQRQKQALKLLRGGLLVKEVAAQLAYKKPHHFSRKFQFSDFKLLSHSFFPWLHTAQRSGHDLKMKSPRHHAIPL